MLRKDSPTQENLQTVIQNQNWTRTGPELHTFLCQTSKVHVMYEETLTFLCPVG